VSDSGSTADQPKVENAPLTEDVSRTGKWARPRLQVWAIALAAGLIAGLGAWLAGELAHGFFQPQVFKVKVGLQTFIQPNATSLNVADLKNAMLVFTALGGVVGLVMGFAGGFAARSPVHGLAVGLAGLIAGVVVGACTSWGLLPFFFRRVVPDPNDLLTPILIHAGVWTAVGALGGAAFGLGMRSGRHVIDAIAGAGFGALLATLVFYGLCEALFPESGALVLVPTSAWVRLLAVFLITILTACGAAKGALGRVPRTPSAV
jgi:hypothetical protein